jgi:hypothetical protein
VSQLYYISSLVCYIFFRVFTSHDCFLARTENFCMPVSSLWMVYRKDTNSQA